MERPEEINLKAIITDNLDVDALIDLVKSRPVIWDKTVEGYRNRDVSIPAWEEIFRIMFDSYDALHVDQKRFIGKVIKDKWTNTRDVWQRTYRKRKEAMQKGENVIDLKDHARYENLMFLAKVYDRDDYFQSEKEEKVFDLSVGNVGAPLSPPQANLNGENFLHINNVNFQNFLRVQMNKKTQRKHGLNPSIQKRKLVKSNVANSQAKNYHRTTVSKPTVINLGKKFKTGFTGGNAKQGTSFVKNVVGNNRTFSQNQFSGEILNSSAIKEEMPSSASNNYIMKSDPDQVPQKVSERRPTQLVNQENVQTPSILIEKSIKLEVIKTSPDHEANEIKVERTPSKEPTQSAAPPNTELDDFFQFLRPRIEDFDKTQIISFFFEMLKPCIKDLNKHQLLDFQIEALQLIKKIERNQVT